jgi:hypothetical protein
MSLKRMMRNARRAVNYEIGTPKKATVGLIPYNHGAQGVSFDLTTEEGRAAGKKWQDEHPQRFDMATGMYLTDGMGK